jgi:hypothetical protein
MAIAFSRNVRKKALAGNPVSRGIQMAGILKIVSGKNPAVNRGRYSELSHKLNSQNILRAIMTVPAEPSAANYHVESNKEHPPGI